MSKTIRRKPISIPYTSKAYIYKPVVRTIEGEIDGKRYKVIVKDGKNPPGTPPAPPENVQIIEWDEAFYLYWDTPDGPVETFEIVMKDSADAVVAEVTELSPNTLDYKFYESDQAGAIDYITNGEQYSFTVKSRLLEKVKSAPEILGTASNKVPQNVVKESQTEDSITLSWDTVAGQVFGYDLVLEDVVNSVVKAREFFQSSPGTASIPGIGLFDVYVQSVSDLSVFKSDKSSAIRIYISDEITDLSATFDNTVDEINVSWTGVDLVDTYNVYSREQGGSFSLLENTTSTNRTYDAFNFGNGVFEFKVVPVKSGLEGKDSNIDSADVTVALILITEDDMNESQSNIVYDGSDVVVKITETDVNETNSTT